MLRRTAGRSTFEELASAIGRRSIQRPGFSPRVPGEGRGSWLAAAFAVESAGGCVRGSVPKGNAENKSLVSLISRGERRQPFSLTRSRSWRTASMSSVASSARASFTALRIEMVAPRVTGSHCVVGVADQRRSAAGPVCDDHQQAITLYRRHHRSPRTKVGSDRRHRVHAIADQGGRRLILRRDLDCGALDAARLDIRSINGSRKADCSVSGPLTEKADGRRRQTRLGRPVPAETVRSTCLLPPTAA
jgi:hypothetical protein